MSGTRSKSPDTKSLKAFSGLRPASSKSEISAGGRAAATMRAPARGVSDVAGGAVPRRPVTPRKKVDRDEPKSIEVKPETPSREDKRKAKNKKILSRDGWILKRGHTLTYVCLFLFTLTLYF